MRLCFDKTDSRTFHELLLSVLLVQVDNNGSSRLLGLSFASGHKALFKRQQAVHFISHQQHASVTGPLLHYFSPGYRVSDQDKEETIIATETLLC